jgi:hypothetical protein
VVGLPIEFAQLGTHARAHLAHEALATGEHGVGEDGSPVLGDEHSVRMQRVDGAVTAPHVDLRFRAWHQATVSIGTDSGVCRRRELSVPTVSVRV